MDVFTTPLPLCKWFNFLIFLILTQTYFSQAPARWEDPKENNTNPPRLPGRKIKFLAPFSDPIDIQNQKLIGFYRGGGPSKLHTILLHVGLTDPGSSDSGEVSSMLMLYAFFNRLTKKEFDMIVSGLVSSE